MFISNGVWVKFNFCFFLLIINHLHVFFLMKSLDHEKISF